MSTNGIHILKQLSIRAVVLGDRAVLLDRHGNRLSGKKVSLDRIVGEVSVAGMEQWVWLTAARRMAQELQRRASRFSLDPWERRVKAMEKSLRLRRRDGRRDRTRLMIDKFKTTTWDTACERLAEQGLSSFRWHSRSGWDRWAQTSANNSNRRSRGEKCPTPRP